MTGSSLVVSRLAVDVFIIRMLYCSVYWHSIMCEIIYSTNCVPCQLEIKRLQYT